MADNDKGPKEALKNAAKDFSIFVTSLSMQALIAMGEVPNPIDNKKEQNLEHAQYVIDTLDMLTEKTKGNLKPDEEKILEDVLYHLRMRYLELSKTPRPEKTS